MQHMPGLDGIRGIAVLLVIAYHFGLGFLPGGFLGVDLFFVLSGFLITSLLLREHGASHRIGLVRFWLRRARRLLPALFVLLLVIAVWAGTTSPFDRNTLRGDILASLAYVANWRFILVGQSYFAQFGTPSPMRHLWSLAIEEQFYILWPLLVFAALSAIATGRRWVVRLVLALLATAILLSAVLMAAMYNEADPSAAYFGTLTRAHEILIGAAAAALVFARPGLSRLVAGRSSLLAGALTVVVVIIAALLHDTDSGYYFGGSVIFSLIAACLISVVVLAASSGQPGSRLLGMRPLVAIGAVSYGAYLWHWPMVVWLTPETTGQDGLGLGLIRLAGTAAATIASFYLVEQPIRRGSIRGHRLTARPVFAGALAVGIALAGLGMVTTRGGEALPAFVSNNRVVLRSAVPGADGTVGLVGDSVAMSLWPGLAYEASQRGLSAVAATFPGCPSGTSERVDRNGKPFSWSPTCSPAVLAGQRDLVQADHARSIVWLSSRDAFDITGPEGILTAGSDGWRTAQFRDWDQTLARLTAHGADVVVLLPLATEERNDPECNGGTAGSSGCTGPRITDAQLAAEYRTWAAGHPDVTVVDLNPVLCPGGAPCPQTVDGVDLRVDGVHLSLDGALLVAGLLDREAPEAFGRGRP